MGGAAASPAHVALNRFGLGARPGEADRLGSPAAARRWLLDQVGEEVALTPEAAPLPPTRKEASEALARVQEAFGARQAPDAQERVRLAQRGVQELRFRDQAVVLLHRVGTDAPFAERLVAFWANHLCVSWRGRLPVAALAGVYEREVVRPHLWGSYEEMVLASARHPAMLLYLDQARSVGPDSPLARTVLAQRERRTQRLEAQGADAPETPPVGLNENYARELLELHTLGVDGGYGQADVEALARLLTGWSVEGPGALGVPGAILGAGGIGPGGVGQRGMGAGGMGAGGTGAGLMSAAPPGEAAAELRFVFRPALHQAGDQYLLGRRYRDPGGAARARGAGEGRGEGAGEARGEGAGEARGEAAIRELCRHPATARFVAGKLAAHFLGDEPDPTSVEVLAERFASSGGNLAEVSRALVELDAPWLAPDRTPARRKFRSPQDWVVASLRALSPSATPGSSPGSSQGSTAGSPRAALPMQGLVPVLEQLRHPLWGPPSPQGYGDALSDWGDPDSLRIRTELARSLAQRFLPGAARQMAPVRAAPRLKALASVLPPAAPDDPLAGFLQEDGIPPVERVALLLASPSFQWR
jgi:uncharacterized protein (DUF1800 family)